MKDLVIAAQQDKIKSADKFMAELAHAIKNAQSLEALKINSYLAIENHVKRCEDADNWLSNLKEVIASKSQGAFLYDSAEG